MNTKHFRDITKKATKTFYNAILFFPKEVRDDVFILYSFLRTADDLIDSNPPQITEFKAFKKMTFSKLKGKTVSNIIIDSFGDVVKRKNLDHSLIHDFFKSLEIDLQRKQYETFEELREFTHGVAEVVGLLMAGVMGLPKKSYKSARKLGLAMQLVNIIRDINEDHGLGRMYIPQKELARYKLPQKLSLHDVQKYPKEFESLMEFQIKRINSLFEEAKEGFRHIPKEYLLPITSAAEIYYQTAEKIRKNPLAIYKRKVRLSRITILSILFKNFIKLHVSH